MAHKDYAQSYSFKQFSKIDNTGQLSIFKSGYKNLRFVLELQEIIVLGDEDSSNLPGLSYKYYGSVDYWRILLAYNGISDPVQDVYAGMKFRIPTRNSVVNWLTQQDTNKVQVMKI